MNKTPPVQNSHISASTLFGSQHCQLSYPLQHLAQPYTYSEFAKGTSVQKDNFCTFVLPSIGSWMEIAATVRHDVQVMKKLIRHSFTGLFGLPLSLVFDILGFLLLSSSVSPLLS
jgi:hypothetical protein